MKRKVLLTFITLMAFGLRLVGQTTEPAKPEMGSYSFGIYGGINFQNINGKDVKGTKLQNSLLAKFHVGINEQIPVAPEFYLQVGLQYTGKGSKGKVPYYTITETREISLHYIELPVNFLYRPLVGKGHFLLGFGPYFGYAFSGKVKLSGDAYSATQDVTFKNKISMSNPDDLSYYKHMDIGANAFFGYEFAKKFTVIFNAQLGLVDINSKNSGIPDSKLSEMNTGFGLTLGYRF